MKIGGRFESDFTSRTRPRSCSASWMLRPKRTTAYGLVSLMIRRSRSVSDLPVRPMPRRSVCTADDRNLLLQLLFQPLQLVQSLNRRECVRLQRRERVDNVTLAGVEERELTQRRSASASRLFHQIVLFSLQSAENLAGPVDDDRWNARQLCHLDSVALVGGAGNDF